MFETHKKSFLLGVILFAAAGTAFAATPDFYIERPSPAMETVPITPEVTVQKFKVTVTTRINGQPEPAKVKIFKLNGNGEKQTLIKEFDAKNGKTTAVKLDSDKKYLIEALFPRVKKTVSKKISNLSKNLNINFNLEYRTLQAASNYNNSHDRAAAANIIIYNRKDQAHPIASAHTDGYVPVSFFLEARQSYVVKIVYDNHEVANSNGQVIYDLIKDTAISFNYSKGPQN